MVAKKQTATFEEVANLYWEKELKYIKTCDEEWRRLTKDAIPAWRSKAISAITVQDVSKLLSKVRERVQLTQSSSSNYASQHGIPAANCLQTRFSRLFRFACEQGLCVGCKSKSKRRVCNMLTDAHNDHGIVRIIIHTNSFPA